MYSLWNRQASCHVNNDPNELDKFAEMSGRFFKYFKDAWDKDELNMVNLFSVLDAKEFGDEKKLKYFSTMLKQKYGIVREYIGRGFTTMVKTGEVYTSNCLKYDEMGRVITDESKPRNISKPCPLSCGTLTMVQS
jgi:hypothetical protein